MSFKIAPGRLYNNNPAPCGSWHCAEVDVALEGVVLASDELFNQVRANLFPGDEITICQFDTLDGDARLRRLVADVRLKITFVASGKPIEWKVMTDVTHYPAPDVAKAKANGAVEPLKAILEIVADPQGGWFVREAGTAYVRQHFVSKIAAKNYIRDFGRKVEPDDA